MTTTPYTDRADLSFADHAEALLADAAGEPASERVTRKVAMAQVYATLALGERVEDATERLEAILDAGLSNIHDALDRLPGGALDEPPPDELTNVVDLPRRPGLLARLLGW